MMPHVCKHFEQEEAGRAAPRGVPVLARYDGRAFHTLTRGLPAFSNDFAACMDLATTALVEDLRPLIAYVQSDEISLLWFASMEAGTLYPFGGNFQKLASVGASIAGVAFARAWPNVKRLPTFDGRAWSVPAPEQALDVFLWRQQDCEKNSVQSAVREHFSPLRIYGKKTPELRAMLADIGKPWEDVPERFRFGRFFRRETVDVELSEAEWLEIPEQHRPPTRGVQRSMVAPAPIRRLADEADPLAALFGRSLKYAGAP